MLRQMTRDTFHVWGGWTFSQNFSSLALTVCDLWYYEDLEEKAHRMNEWMNESMNYEAVYRTAPATPGLLNNLRWRFKSQNKISILFWRFKISKAVTPISSGFPELAPDPEQLDFLSKLALFFSEKLRKSLFFTLPWWLMKKLDGVGPVDNRPSTD